MGKLEGKVAVITGGATGIGRAAARRFIKEGAVVFIFGRRQDVLDAAVAELGPNARSVRGSVSDEADLDRLYAAVRAERGSPRHRVRQRRRGQPGGKLGSHRRRAHRRDVRHQRQGHHLHGAEGAAADARGWLDHPHRLERRHHRCTGR